MREEMKKNEDDTLNFDPDKADEAKVQYLM